MNEFKIGDKVIFAREDDRNYIWENSDFTIGKEYEVAEMDEGFPRMRADYGMLLFMPPECFDLVPEPRPEIKPEPKYPIIEKFGTYKVVFNPPYTIVEAYIFGEPYFKGKAKCNPKDTFDKWEGFKIAMSRLEQI